MVYNFNLHAYINDSFSGFYAINIRCYSLMRAVDRRNMYQAISSVYVLCMCKVVGF